MQLAIFGISFYRNILSPIIHRLGVVPFGCRYEVTCSEYAENVIKKYGLIKGGKLAFVRIMSCHP